MSFTSLPFLVLVLVSVGVYYLLPKKGQWVALLAASMVFYCRRQDIIPTQYDSYPYCPQQVTRYSLI